MYRMLLALFLVNAAIAVCPDSVYESGVKPEEQQLIIDWHNYYRTLVARAMVANQPQGANLFKMRWDENLARGAQYISDTCVFQHLGVSDPRFPVGQNLYLTWDAMVKLGANWTAAIESWFSEYSSYTFGVAQYNHYTQVIWAKTYLVGCGYKHFKGPHWNQKFFVCHYGPAGNFIGEQPYVVGPGCIDLCIPPA